MFINSGTYILVFFTSILSINAQRYYIKKPLLYKDNCNEN